MIDSITNWILKNGDPWTRYNVLTRMLEIPESSAEVEDEKDAMFRDPRIVRLFNLLESVDWGNPPWTYLRDASMPVHILGVLADFGFKVYEDRRLWRICSGILEQQDENGELKFKPYIVQPLTCLSSTALYPVVKMGFKRDERVLTAVNAYLSSTLFHKGWRCTLEPFKGYLFDPKVTKMDYRLKRRESFLKSMARRGVTCPLATLNILRVLVEYPELLEHPRVIEAVEGLLAHWRIRGRPCGFGIGSNFMKLKYPFVWYDILKYTHVLSKIPYARERKEFRKVLGVLWSKRLSDYTYKPESVYRFWREFDFGVKKPSPWITLLIYEIYKNAGFLDI